MGNFDDFDLDLRNSQETYRGDGANVSAIATSAVRCTADLSNWLNCTPACPTPTLGEGQKPAASCHKNVNATVQPRC